MKIIYLSFSLCILFLAQTLGCDGSDQYAHELWEKDKERMVVTGVTSWTELEELKIENDKIVSNFVNAEAQGDPTQADSYRVAFAELVERLVALSTKG